MWKRKEGRLFIAIHLAFLAACLCFPLYKLFADKLPSVFSGCILHDRFFLYCPLCGGTRAVEALLSFRLSEAFACNAYVVSLLLIALLLDAVAFVRLLCKKRVILRLPSAFWICLAVGLVVWGIARNLLMIFFFFDPVGDLGAFWRVIRSAPILHIF